MKDNTYKVIFDSPFDVTVEYEGTSKFMALEIYHFLLKASVGHPILYINDEVVAW